jgi:hypothetical protein
MANCCRYQHCDPFSNVTELKEILNHSFTELGKLWKGCYIYSCTKISYLTGYQHPLSGAQWSIAILTKNTFHCFLLLPSIALVPTIANKHNGWITNIILLYRVGQKSLPMELKMIITYCIIIVIFYFTAIYVCMSLNPFLCLNYLS